MDAKETTSLIVIVTADNARVRTSPSFEAGTIGRLSRGFHLPLISKQGKWFQVDIVASGKKTSGYIHQSVAVEETLGDATAPPIVSSQDESDAAMRMPNKEGVAELTPAPELSSNEQTGGKATSPDQGGNRTGEELQTGASVDSSPSPGSADVRSADGRETPVEASQDELAGMTSYRVSAEIKELMRTGAIDSAAEKCRQLEEPFNVDPEIQTLCSTVVRESRAPKGLPTIDFLPYFPMAKGTQWNYIAKIRSLDGELQTGPFLSAGKIRCEVAGREKISGFEYVKFVYKSKGAGTRDLLSEKVIYRRSSAAGVYELREGARDKNGYFSIPANPHLGEKWRVEHQDIQMDCVAERVDRVVSGQRSYNDVAKITCQGQVGGENYSAEEYYQAGMGLVKQITRRPNFEVELDLEISK